MNYYANQLRVNGPVSYTKLGGYQATPNPRIASQLKVALNEGDDTAVSSQPYWIVSAKSNGRGYDWVIVSAGIPVLESRDKCIPSGITTGTDNTDSVGNGFYILTRQQTINDAAMDAMKQSARNLGLDAEALIRVEQSECNYAIPLDNKNT